MRLSAYLFCFVIILIGLAGCGGLQRPEGMPNLYPTTVTLTQDGAPVAEASVNIFPEDPVLARWGASASTDTQGQAVFYTHGKYPGVVAGTYKVVVYKTETEPSTFVGDYTEARRAEFQKAEDARKSFNLIDTAYGNVEKTPLRLEVTQGKKNETVFDLGKPVRILIKHVN